MLAPPLLTHDESQQALGQKVFCIQRTSSSYGGQYAELRLWRGMRCAYQAMLQFKMCRSGLTQSIGSNRRLRIPAHQPARLALRFVSNATGTDELSQLAPASREFRVGWGAEFLSTNYHFSYTG